eukprot:TRINITY_DN1705_c0_g1_i2.p1 TRINITY_DN1705_c0_g1~~TRINITY_DN1705_c0_g1_i2.p1  ORF type:complete len:133 (+),score=35.23 TRINITY_DN1705_c0_g1_i2:484-882(+)
MCRVFVKGKTKGFVSRVKCARINDATKGFVICLPSTSPMRLESGDRSSNIRGERLSHGRTSTRDMQHRNSLWFDAANEKKEKKEGKERRKRKKEKKEGKEGKETTKREESKKDKRGKGNREKARLTKQQFQA